MAIFYCRSLDYYCACVIILVMHLLCFENFLQDILKFFNKRKRKGEEEDSAQDTQPSKKTRVVCPVEKVG